METSRRGFFGGLAALLIWSKRKPPLDPHYVYKGGLRGLHDDGTQLSPLHPDTFYTTGRIPPKVTDLTDDVHLP